MGDVIDIRKARRRRRLIEQGRANHNAYVGRLEAAMPRGVLACRYPGCWEPRSADDARFCPEHVGYEP